MRVPFGSSGLNVSKVAQDQKEKASDQISGAQKNRRKESWLYIEDDMRVPWVSSLLNISVTSQKFKTKQMNFPSSKFWNQQKLLLN